MGFILNEAEYTPFQGRLGNHLKSCRDMRHGYSGEFRVRELERNLDYRALGDVPGFQQGSNLRGRRPGKQAGWFKSKALKCGIIAEVLRVIQLT